MDPALDFLILAVADVARDVSRIEEVGHFHDRFLRACGLALGPPSEQSAGLRAGRFGRGNAAQLASQLSSELASRL